MRRLLGLIVLPSLAFAGLFATHASATTVLIPASKDNTLYQQVSGVLSNGAGMSFFAGNSGANEIRRGLIAFDIQAGVPHGATITGATLRLHMSQTASGAQTVALRRVTADWGEGTSDASGGEGGGAPSTTGDATWIHRFFNTTLWANVAGDFTGSASATQTVADTAFYTWTGAGVVADVQQWLDSPASNSGWIVLGNEGASGTAKRFDSRQNPAATLQPVLTVDYVRNVPATTPASRMVTGFALMALAGAALVSWRARNGDLT